MTLNLMATCPNWVYFSFGFGLWIYASFDAIDGKQARRTGTSGPLGELFDHSCDALNTTFVGLLAISAIKIEKDWWAISHIFISYANFYLTTWETYYTGTLYLSYFSGPVEGLTGVCLCLMLTGYVGNATWAQSIRSLLGLSIGTLPFIPDVPVNKLIILFTWLVLSLNSVVSIYNAVFSSGKKTGPSSLLGLAPFLLASGLGYLWLLASPHIFVTCLVPFIIFLGFTVAYNVGLIILAHLTKTPFPFFNHLYLFLIFGALNSNMPLLFNRPALLQGPYEIAYVYYCMAHSVAFYFYYSSSVINEICEYFDIYCLSIKHLDRVPGYKTD
ncbi:hypothetical protein DSO57_1037420 [Entomophthora muscae]|uniref:Uncharacterized protein n=1 Tax=Entomophthora muscae TaxID=34485 RepID=A0ACC2TLE3_9FUNG|nr:hypothetical protein DSO57_1037420 [Entomophthora muscae]